eukprot:gene8245-48790_t
MADTAAPGLRYGDDEAGAGGRNEFRLGRGTTESDYSCAAMGDDALLTLNVSGELFRQKEAEAQAAKKRDRETQRVSLTIANYDGDSGDQRRNFVKVQVPGVIAIDADGDYKVRYEDYVLESTADVPVSRPFGPTGGWWKIDGRVCPTPSAAVGHLTSRGFREVGRFANGNSVVVTFARDP